MSLRAPDVPLLKTKSQVMFSPKNKVENEEFSQNSTSEENFSQFGKNHSMKIITPVRKVFRNQSVKMTIAHQKEIDSKF